MSANYSAEAFPGQSDLIDLIKSMKTFFATQRSMSGVRRTDPTELSEQYFRTLSEAELRHMALTLAEKYSTPVRDNSLSERFDAYRSPYSGRHISEASG